MSNTQTSLTRDELLQLDGKPVYCIDGEGHKCWCVVNVQNEECIDNEAGGWIFAFYGLKRDTNELHKLGWLAYLSEVTL